MSTFADLAAELDDSAPPARKSLADLADELSPPVKKAAAPKTQPKFQTNDPAEMRRQILASGDPAVLAVFDRQFPQYAPKVAQPAPAASASPAAPAPVAPPPPGQPTRGAAAIPSGTRPDGSLIYPAPAVQAPEPSLWDRIKGIGEAALTTATGATTGYLGGVASAVDNAVRTVGYVASGTPLTEEMKRVHAGEEAFGRGAAALTYAPRTATGQEYAGNVADAVAPLGPLAGHGAELAAMGAVAQRAAPGFAKEAANAKAAVKSVVTGTDAPPAARIEPTFSQPKPVYRQVNGQWQATGEVRDAGSALPAAQEVATVPRAKVGPVTFDSPPIDGGLPKEAVPERAGVLKRIGLDSVRRSAVSGDAAAAAQDFQVSKFTSESAGLAAKAQFDTERQALVNHGENTVHATGGTVGLDQDVVNTRGQTIAAPFDALRSYLEQKKKALYTAADQTANGLPSVQPEGLRALLADPDFTETLLAKNQGAFLDSVKRQLDRFTENKPDGAGGLSVQSAEKFRQWLNKTWSPDTNGSIGALKGALDDDVFKSAGQDIYSRGRDLHVLEKQTLDNPSGVSRLMDFDPHTPINRVTPFDKIPDRLASLPPAQFKNIVDTLKGMPPELQPQAQRALAEIQAHYANKMLDAGANNKGQWNAKKVSDFRRANSANVAAAFESNPQALGMLNDLQSAGHILDYPSSYPGAAAQAAQAVKRGLMSGIVEKGGSYIGAGVGGVFGPVGASTGSAVGGAIGARAGQSMGEKGALKRWQSGVTRLSDVGR